MQHGSFLIGPFLGLPSDGGHAERISHEFGAHVIG
jgi:hypothetical protein